MPLFVKLTLDALQLLIKSKTNKVKIKNIDTIDIFVGALRYQSELSIYLFFVQKNFLVYSESFVKIKEYLAPLKIFFSTILLTESYC